MAQHVQCAVDGFEAIHRYEDLALIAEVLRAYNPQRVVELGTAGGGFAAFLAKTVQPWGGLVLTIDKTLPDSLRARLGVYLNLRCLQLDLFATPQLSTSWIIENYLAHPQACLYTDNGNKMRELELFAPLLPRGGLVGTHDYGTEVDPVWVEGFMGRLGYQPERHADFARLAHPEFYPISLTRFWIRATETPEPS